MKIINLFHDKVHHVYMFHVITFLGEFYHIIFSRSFLQTWALMCPKPHSLINELYNDRLMLMWQVPSNSCFTSQELCYYNTKWNIVQQLMQYWTSLKIEYMIFKWSPWAVAFIFFSFTLSNSSQSMAFFFW